MKKFIVIAILLFNFAQASEGVYSVLVQGPVGK
jgi:hypothetical protein